MTMHKSLSRVTVKDADLGTVEACFSTFGVIDADGDVLRKEAFTDGQPVAISAYGHTSWKGEMPVGKGRIRVTDDEAILEGQFFMNTTHGRDTFETVKAMSEGDNLQEWSYSLRGVKAKRITLDGRSANEIAAMDPVTEVSPVLKGAGVNTRTLAVKAAKQLDSTINRLLRDAGRERWGTDTTYVYPMDYDVDEGFAIYCIYDDTEADRYVRVDFTRDDNSLTLGDSEVAVEQVTSYAPKGARFSEQATAVLADVDQLVARASEVVALRAEKGKAIAPATAEQLSTLDGALERLKALLAEPTPPSDEAAANELARCVAIAQGVPLP